MIVSLKKSDVQSDIAAALSLCLAIDLQVVAGHNDCPFYREKVANKAVEGLCRLLDRFKESA